MNLTNEMYREQMLDHYESPRHQGTLTAPDGSFADSNPMCGDRIRIEVQLDETGTVLADAAFTGDGCIVSQAAASLLLDDAVGQLVTTIEALEPQHVLKLIGMPLTAQRVKCALLSFKVLKAALHEARIQSPPAQSADSTHSTNSTQS